MSHTVPPLADAGDLLHTLAATPWTRRALRLRGRIVRFPRWQDLRAQGVPAPLVEGIVRLSLGDVVELSCGGAYAERWRVVWKERATGRRVAAVLDASERLLSTTAPGDEAIVGFAVASIGYTLAMPAVGFDGEWASLLATVAIEGEGAYRPLRVADIAKIVMDALAIDEFGGEEDPRPWRTSVVRDEGELPVLEPAPAAVRRALGLAPSPLGMGSVVASFGRFAECARDWKRSVPMIRERSFIGPEAEAGAQVLVRGLHVVLEGPRGTGKSVAARDTIAAWAGHEGCPAPLGEIALDGMTDVAQLVGHVGADGTWVDGPLRAAMTVGGEGTAIHLSSAEPLSPAVRRVVRAILGAWSLPAGLVPGMPATESGRSFRLVLELTTGEAPVNGATEGSELTAGTTAGYLVFGRLTGPRLLELLATHRSTRSVPEAWRSFAAWVVDEMEYSVREGKLPRVLSPAELIAWVYLAGGMVRRGNESDMLEAYFDAAATTWLGRLPDGLAWWNRHVRGYGDAVVRRTIRHLEHGHEPSVDPAAIGLDAWRDLLEVRTTADRLSATINPAPHLVLLPCGSDPLGSAWGVCRIGGPFVWTAEDPPVMRTAEDRFAYVVLIASHERAHARWSDGYGVDTIVRAEGAEAQAQQRWIRCCDILEDMRIERLIDRHQWPELAPYRARAARAMNEGWSLEGVEGSSAQLLALVHHMMYAVPVHGEAAWERAREQGRAAGLPAMLVEQGLFLMRSAGEIGERTDVVPDLARRLAALAEAADAGKQA